MIILLRAQHSPKQVAKDIASLMEEQLNQRVRVTSKIRLVTPNDIVIRWGNVEEFPRGVSKEINSRESIRKINNKIACRKVLIENDIPVPTTFFNKQSVNIFPVIGRPTFHSQGKNLILIKNREQLLRDRISTYWSVFISKDEEFRVFVYNYKIFYICEKEPRDKEEVSWNFSTGNSTFGYREKRSIPKALRLACIESCKLVEANFAAVDVIKKGDDFYIIELNSAPAIYGIIKRKLAKRLCADCVGGEVIEDE